MKRLTEKGTNKTTFGNYQVRSGDNVIYERKENLEEKRNCDIYNKLVQLEDIEQELGIDLITLFNEDFIAMAKNYINETDFMVVNKNEFVFKARKFIEFYNIKKTDTNETIKKCVRDCFNKSDIKVRNNFTAREIYNMSIGFIRKELEK